MRSSAQSFTRLQSRYPPAVFLFSAFSKRRMSFSKLQWLLTEFSALWWQDWGAHFLADCQPGAALNSWCEVCPQFLVPYVLHRGHLTTLVHLENLLLLLAKKMKSHITYTGQPYHHSCRILLVRSKSQIPSPLKGSGLHKSMTPDG